MELGEKKTLMVKNKSYKFTNNGPLSLDDVSIGRPANLYPVRFMRVPYGHPAVLRYPTLPPPPIPIPHFSQDTK